MSNAAAAGAAQPGPTPQADAYTRIKWNGWGTRDVALKLDETDPLVVIHTSGKKIRGLIPFVHKEIKGLPLPIQRPEKTPSITTEEAARCLPPPVVNAAFVAELMTLFKPDQYKNDAEVRLTHMVGKNYRDLWRARRGMIARAPDAIVLPHSHDDCVKLMECAVKHNVVLIPFGGGTNVTGCIEAAAFEKTRMVVSVDTRRMGRMLSIDRQSRTAVFECGVLGPDMEEQLGRNGFTFGHDPDSFVYSTLGGWIGARSSGAMSNSYGDIEQMVIALKVVTPTGVVETPAQARVCAIDLNGLFIGSEGCFGIITEATVKLEPIPERKVYEGWLFPSFERGYHAFSTVTRLGHAPTAMRLYDEDETRMSFAMRTEEKPNFFKDTAAAAIKQYLQHVKGFDLGNVALCIVGFEGTEEHVAHIRDVTSKIFKEHDGFGVGPHAGQNWQDKKYDLPYVRDFALSHNLWADVFETCTVYSEALPLWRAVKEAVREVWRAEGKRGWIGCHTAHQYRVGCCLYFTYAGSQIDQNDFETFLKVKRAATEAMLRHRGNLTHHHGIGYEHVPWMDRYFQAGALDLMLSIKAQIDPKDICNPYKLLPVRRKAGESDAQLKKRRLDMQLFDKLGIPRAQSKL